MHYWSVTQASSLWFPSLAWICIMLTTQKGCLAQPNLWRLVHKIEEADIFMEIVQGTFISFAKHNTKRNYSNPFYFCQLLRYINPFHNPAVSQVLHVRSNSTHTYPQPQQTVLIEVLQLTPNRVKFASNVKFAFVLPRQFTSVLFLFLSSTITQTSNLGVVFISPLRNYIKQLVGASLIPCFHKTMWPTKHIYLSLRQSIQISTDCSMFCSMYKMPRVISSSYFSTPNLQNRCIFSRIPKYKK